MVAIKEIRASNATLKSSAPGQVSVFIGATSGLGKTTAIQLAKLSNAPKIYLVGRSKTKLSQLSSELQCINSQATISIIVAEISLISQVDVACKEILEKESRVDSLYTSTGYLSFERIFRTEGLDELANLHHYTRTRFIQLLLPLLTASPSPRVVSIGAGGKEGKLFINDLPLLSDYSFINSADHFTSMHTLALEQLAKKNPEISFLHIYPGYTDTGIVDRLFDTSKGGIGYYLQALARYTILSLLRLFVAIPIEEAGEREAYFGLSERYPSRKMIERLGEGHEKGFMKCSVEGNGVYLVNWNGETSANEKILRPYRRDGMDLRFGSILWRLLIGFCRTIRMVLWNEEGTNPSRFVIPIAERVQLPLLLPRTVVQKRSAPLRVG